MFSWILIFLFIIHKEATNSLRLSKLVVPSVKFRGENALLECLYELNNQKNHSRNYVYENGRYYRRNNNNYFYDNEDEQEEIIYSVKWYKDGEEFYRYVPKAKPLQTKYDFDGIKVDLKKSDSLKVYLRNLSFKTSGLFKCEVSLEGPSFSSVQGESYMQVVYLPTSDPVLTEDKQALKSNDKLNLNCTSGKSFPGSNLQFFINDNPITNPKYIISYPDILHPHGLISTSIGLDMRISSKFFEDGVLRISCVASISPTIWSGETVIQQGLLQQFPDIPSPSIDRREVMFLVKSHAISTISSSTRVFIITAFLFIIYNSMAYR